MAVLITDAVESLAAWEHNRFLLIDGSKGNAIATCLALSPVLADVTVGKDLQARKIG